VTILWQNQIEHKFSSLNHSHLNRGHQTDNNRHDPSTTHLITSRAEEHKSLEPRKKSDIYQLSTNNVQHPGIPSSKTGGSPFFCLTTYTTLEKTRCSIGSGHCVWIVEESSCSLLKHPVPTKKRAWLTCTLKAPLLYPDSANFEIFIAELNRNGTFLFWLVVGSSKQPTKRLTEGSSFDRIHWKNVYWEKRDFRNFLLTSFVVQIDSW
jgi:hypothetical protein